MHKHVSLHISLPAALLACAVWLCGCSHTWHAPTIVSPDGTSEASVGYRERRGPWIPGRIELPKVQSRKDAFEVRRDGRIVFRTQPVELARGDRTCDDALDVVWSPDSTQLAYRRNNDLHIIDLTSKTMRALPLADDLFLITSFRWLDQSNLLVMLKESLGGLGFSKAHSVRIVGVNIKTSGYEVLLDHPVDKPVLLFRSPLSRIEEISPYSERVAFSDGHHLKIFDANSMGFVADVALPGSIDGIWWHDEDRLLVGSGLLTRDYRFFTITVSDEITEEVTDQLVPVWMMWLSNLSVCPYGAWADPRWYERGESLFE
jgi:hypothetical protein